MDRTTSLLACLFFGMVSFSFAQEPPLNQQTPEDAFGTRQLIAWSSLQKPQPAPQPLPPRDTPIPQPGQQPDLPQPGQQPDQQSKSPADPQTEQSPAQSFTGKIVKDGAEFVLKAAGNTTYQLDGQSDLQRFENQNVRVTGTLDTGANRIHIVKIELMS